MRLSEIIDALDATLLIGKDQLDNDITRCGGADLMSDILNKVSENSLLLTGLGATSNIEPVFHVRLLRPIVRLQSYRA